MLPGLNPVSPSFSRLRDKTQVTQLLDWHGGLENEWLLLVVTAKRNSYCSFSLSCEKLLDVIRQQIRNELNQISYFDYKHKCEPVT